jgi:hypothetical protein
MWLLGCASSRTPLDEPQSGPDAGAATAAGSDDDAEERPDYAFVFDPTVIRTYHLTFEESAWQTLQDEWTEEVPAMVIDNPE